MSLDIEIKYMKIIHRRKGGKCLKYSKFQPVCENTLNCTVFDMHIFQYNSSSIQSYHLSCLSTFHLTPPPSPTINIQAYTSGYKSKKKLCILPKWNVKKTT